MDPRQRKLLMSSGIAAAVVAIVVLAVVIAVLRRQPALKLKVAQPQPAGGAADTLAPVETGLLLRESNGAAGKHAYSIYIPPSYTPAGEFPAIVFLHGIGESGKDGAKPITVGIGPYIAMRADPFPFIVIWPQTGFNWANASSEQIMLDALADARANYRGIDAQRISLTGMSSGGKGTWWIGARHPEIFAALVPMGGFESYESVPRLTTIPIWALHNKADYIVPVGGTQEMVRQIKAAGGNIRFSEGDAEGHDCWTAAYENGELFTWLTEQRRAN